ncbi:hypothetical protein F5Y15DRAFT_166753 [Xylariaceae sp. FL0016]|nr:hypothetical protein F5Y15DRAFT_166753 [Xylariaceae sp. FL0016]
MSLSAPTPPLLLTKRLTSFLRANVSPQIHTTLLTTLSGKLLAHASPHPVGTLRTQCTVAASLWALYAAPSTSDSIAESLPSESSSHPQQELASSAITIQLAGAVVVIRRLHCGLLFVCIGPPPEVIDQSVQAQAHQQSGPMRAPESSADSQPTPPLGSPSEAESVTSAGAATTASVTTTTSIGASAVVVMRKQAEELARWLNDKLGSLDIPEESLGGLEGR